jgi:hypothetical protein
LCPDASTCSTLKKSTASPDASNNQAAKPGDSWIARLKSGTALFGNS